VNRLREYRKRKGLTQVEVASLLELEQSAVSEHEAGRRRLSAEHLARYAKLYECRMDDLYTLEQPDDTTKEVKSA
jgi:transcriptional regulator with XRE-family HTH domain